MEEPGTTNGPLGPGGDVPEIDVADLVERAARGKLERLEAETDPTIREAQRALREALRDMLDALDEER